MKSSAPACYGTRGGAESRRPVSRHRGAAAQAFVTVSVDKSLQSGNVGGIFDVKRNTYRLLMLAGAVAFLMGCLGGCKGKKGTDPAGREATLSGNLQIVGSTSMKRFVNCLAEGFMEEYPDVSAAVEFTGSGAGIEAVAEGVADIGNASRNLTREEKAKGVVENIVALDGIAVCVDRGNTLEGLSGQQLADIYTGVITRWSDLGGENVPVVVVGREAGSGTRMAFEEILKVEDKCAYANELDSTGAVMARVAVTPGAIGYVSFDAVNDSVKTMSLESVEPTAENIRAGKYLLSRPFAMATKGEISRQSRLVQAWFAYVYGEEGQRIAEQSGLVRVK